MRVSGLVVVAMAVLASVPVNAEAWVPIEKVQTYSIKGKSGIELYQSIGEHGPKAGAGRAIAITDFDLKWSRDYRPKDGGCILAAARPHLTIFYRLPRPSNELPVAIRPLWKHFITGVETHERIHGAMIIKTVKKIEAATVGTFVAGDSGCVMVRKEVERRTVPPVEEQRRLSREFDAKELSNGGNVHSLVLGLVNG